MSPNDTSSDLKILGLITARGGSKGIPHKNIVPVAGRPLLAYTCDAALGSKGITRAILSTDDEEIARVGRECGIEVPFMRPPELAADNTPSIDVAIHALRWLEEHEGWKADVLVLLQPTSPLRQAKHLDEALDILEKTSADTVVSVVRVPHHYSPYKIMQLEDGWLRNFWREPLPFDSLNRHNLPVFYARNGPAVLITRASVILEKRSFYGEHVGAYEMSEEASFDIDTPFDLRMVEWLLNDLVGKSHES